MKNHGPWLLLLMLLATATGVSAEARRDDGNDALRKAQYMMRELSQENSQLQVSLAELQAKVDELTTKSEASDSDLSKARSKTSRLESRIHADADKFKELLRRYRESISELKRTNLDNRYLARAVEEREDWIEQCGGLNDGLFEANSELLARYGEVAGRKSNPVTGFAKVKVENEVQEYRFKLEDLQSRQFQPQVDAASHVRPPQDVEEAGVALN